MLTTKVAPLFAIFMTFMTSTFCGIASAGDKSRMPIYSTYIDLKESDSRTGLFDKIPEKIRFDFYDDGNDVVTLVTKDKGWFKRMREEVLFKGQLKRIPLRYGQKLNDQVKNRMKSYHFVSAPFKAVETAKVAVETAKGTLLIEYQQAPLLIRDRYHHLTTYDAFHFEHGKEKFKVLRFDDREPFHAQHPGPIASVSRRIETKMDERGNFVDFTVDRPINPNRAKHKTIQSTWLIRQSDGAALKIAARRLPLTVIVKDDIADFNNLEAGKMPTLLGTELRESFAFNLATFDDQLMHRGIYRKPCSLFIRDLFSNFSGQEN